MKIDRLIGIITLLLQKDTITIAQLADRFEVSGRTIQRDIGTLCQAGIPVVALQGRGGGLSLADGYKLDATVLSRAEMQAVLAGVQSMDSILQTTHRRTLAEKLTQGRQAVLAQPDILLIDLASFYKESLPDKVSSLQQAIQKQSTVSFTYYAENGETHRTVEPCCIVYQWAAWYMYGYCRSRQDFRLFKLNRMWELKINAQTFLPRAIPPDGLHFDQFLSTEQLQVTALFQPAVKHRLIEEYGPDCYTLTEEGQLLFQRPFASFSYALEWLLSFGSRVQVLSPAGLAATLRQHAAEMMQLYS